MPYPRLALFLLSIIAVFILGVILHQLQTVLIPFVIALLLSNIFAPAVLYLKQKRLPMALSLATVLLAFFAVIFLISLIVFSSVETFIEEVPKYEARLRNMVNDLLLPIGQLATDYFGVTEDNFDITQLISLPSITSTAATAFRTGAGSFLSFLSNTFLVLLFMMFILAGTGELGFKIERAFSSHYAPRIARVIENIDQQVRQYLLVKTLISLATGTLTTVLLWILGVDFALLWGFLAFLLNYIPNIGSLVAVLFPLALSMVQFETFTRPLLVLTLLGGTQMLMGNVIEPRLLASSLNLSALLVLVALIFWGWLWGIWGMILAVPLCATIKIIFENIDPLRPLSVMMSGAIPPSD